MTALALIESLLSKLAPRELVQVQTMLDRLLHTAGRRTTAADVRRLIEEMDNDDAVREGRRARGELHG